MSDLVGNHEDRFSQNEAHFMVTGCSSSVGSTSAMLTEADNSNRTIGTLLCAGDLVMRHSRYSTD